jgi:hypothetical protein
MHRGVSTGCPPYIRVSGNLGRRIATRYDKLTALAGYCPSKKPAVATRRLFNSQYQPLTL